MPTMLLMEGLGCEAREALPDLEPPWSVGDGRRKERSKDLCSLKEPTTCHILHVLSLMTSLGGE